MPQIHDYSSVIDYFNRIRPDNSSNKLPEVTIVTAVKNDRLGLEKTITSVKEQNYQKLEHLIINGGNELSLDNLILNEPDLGISDAFNKGVAAAKGEIILILNAGDTLVSNAIENIVVQFERDRSLEIICASAIFREEGQPDFFRKAEHHRLIDFMSVVHNATFVTKSVYEKIGLYDLDFKLAMDYEFLLRAKNNNIKFLSIDKVAVVFNLGGISDRRWFNALIETIKAKRINNYKINISYFIYCFLYHLSYVLLRKLGLFSIIKLCRKRFSSLSYYSQ